MREMLQSLSLTSGAVVLAVVCGLIAYVASRATSLKAGAVVGVLASGVLSFSLYWAPVWLGAAAAEYSAWAVLIIGVWFIAGVVGAVGACLLFGWRQAQHNRLAKGAHV